MDYSFGTDPVFETLKCALRLPEKPWLIGAAARLSGFLWSWAHRDQRPVSDEFVAYLRQEQKQRISAMKIAPGLARKVRPLSNRKASE